MKKITPSTRRPHTELPRKPFRNQFGAIQRAETSIVSVYKKMGAMTFDGGVAKTLSPPPKKKTKYARQ